MPDVAAPEISDGSFGDPRIWALLPGETIERQMLHDRYGGRVQGRIGPSRRSPNVMLFAGAPAGIQRGYLDGWHDDGCFHYTGEGQRGDQQMKSGNTAILGHAGAGCALRLFTGTKGRVLYEGEFQLEPGTPFYTADAPEVGDGPVRNVIVFRLQPLDVRPRPGSAELDRAGGPGVEDVPVEEQWTEKAFLAPGQKAGEAERREQELVLAFHEHLLKQSHEVVRVKIMPPGEAKPLIPDLFDRTTNTLYEAKGSVERGAIRMALGQLLDYSRFLTPKPRLAVLLPSEPREDLQELLKSAGVHFVWRERKKFVDSEPVSK
jgi:hypothetical protein